MITTAPLCVTRAPPTAFSTVKGCGPLVLTQAEEMGRATVKGSTVVWIDDGSGFYVGDAAGNITHFSSEGQQLAVLQPG
eukprot:COSAG01_NODE_1481_length_10160_cov_18.500149_2_plen_79_part_00